MTNNDQHWIVNVLEYVTVQSTIDRKKVGAIIVGKNGLLLGQGFNTVPRNAKKHECEDQEGNIKPSWTLHAEAKAISYAANKGRSTKGSTLYCTIPPCPACCGLIIEAGIKRVVYKEKYWSESNLHLLEQAGVTVSKFDENELQTTS